MPISGVELPVLDDVAAFLAALGETLRARLAPTHERDEPQDAASAVDMAAISVGRRVARAKSEAELDEAISEGLESPWLFPMLAFAWEAIEELPRPEVIPIDDSARALRALDTPVSKLFAQGFMLTGDTSRALARAIDDGTLKRARSGGARLPRAVTVAEVIADPEMPPVIGRHVLALFRGIVTVAGLAELIREHGIVGALAHPIAAPLASRWVASLRQYLRLLASFEPGLVSEQVIPLSERLDLRAIESEHLAACARLDALPRGTEQPFASDDD